MNKIVAALLVITASSNLSCREQELDKYDIFYKLYKDNQIERISFNFKKALRDSTNINHNAITDNIKFLSKQLDLKDSLMIDQEIRNQVLNYYDKGVQNFIKVQRIGNYEKYIEGLGNTNYIAFSVCHESLYPDNCFLVQDEKNNTIIIFADNVFWEGYGQSNPLFGLIVDGPGAQPQIKKYIQFKDNRAFAFYDETLGCDDLKNYDFAITK